MKYVVSAELVLFLIFAAAALNIWLRAKTPTDAIDGTLSIIFGAASGVILLLTLSASWAWSALA
jgi:hypothetical protein